MKFMLNCDMGETEVVERLGHDMKCLDFVHMANIACDGHAGSDAVMIEVLKACKAKSVLPGAHPSYPDRHNFGRTTIPATTDDIRQWAHDQVHRLAQHSTTVGVSLHHVKPHGALYHDTMNNKDIADAFIQGVLSAQDILNTIDIKSSFRVQRALVTSDSMNTSRLKDASNKINTTYDPRSQKIIDVQDPYNTLTTKNSPTAPESRNTQSIKANHDEPKSRIKFDDLSTSGHRSVSKHLYILKSHNNQKIAIVGQSNSQLEKATIQAGLPFLCEAFADRKYLPNGALQPRSIPGSVLNTEQAVAQLKSMIETGQVISTEGPIPIRFNTVCVHGDSPDAISILKSIHQL